MYGFIIISVLLALSVATYNFYAVKRRSTGSELMNEIAYAIQEGASAFISHEMKIIVKIGLLITIVLVVMVSWYTGVAFIIGALMAG